MINKLSLKEILREHYNASQRPLQKLMSCKITKDGKYIIYEGNAYFTITGDRVPINEEWTLSDILHTGADLLSAGMDFIIPGSGAVVDILNAISYIIEAQYKQNEEKDSLYLMAAVTFGFVVLPGPLQAASVPLKKFLKGGVKVATPIVKTGLGVIYRFLDTILGGALKQIDSALNSNLAKRILSKFNKQSIIGYFQKFKTRIKDLLSKLLPNNVKSAGKQGTESILKYIDANPKLLPMSNTAISKELLPAVVAKLNTLSRASITLGRNAAIIINKLGIKPGVEIIFSKAGRTGKKMKVKNVSDYLDVEVIVDGVNTIKKYKTWDFLKTYILNPSAKLNTTKIPLSTKFLLRIFNSDGTVNQQELNTLPAINFTLFQNDLIYLSELTANYQGDTQKYSVNTNVTPYQQALMLLNYTLKGNDDGKFGPSTKFALEDFQKKNGLNNVGRMDRLTAKKLSSVLLATKPKGKFNYQEVADKLNSLS